MKKFLVALTLISLISFSLPQKSHAQYVDIPNNIKEYGLDALAYQVSAIVIKKLTAKTVNWINSGFKGNPGYVQNPKQFFLDIGDETASSFLSQAGVNQICSPFRAQVRLALVKNYIDSDENYSCSLSVLRNNFEAFTQDFSEGGWAGWFEVTQNPQNNPIGSYIQARNRLSMQVGQEQNQYKEELNFGSGFLNFKRCPRDAVYTAIGPNGQEERCAVDEETVTPGMVINDQLTNSLGSSWERLNAADEFNEVITALLSQLIEQMTDRGTGLFGASARRPDGGSYTNDLSNENQPVTNYQIGATPGGINCNATGGSGGGGGSGEGGEGGGTGEGGEGGGGGSVRCTSTPPVITGIPPWPLGAGGGSGGSCSPYTPNPGVDCTNVDSGAVLGILNNYPPSNNGLRAAIGEIQGLYPQAEILDHPVRLDKINFGNGMDVDVIGGAIGNANGSEDDEGTGWMWGVECACNRDPSGSTGTGPTPLPGTNTYTVTFSVSGPGIVSDGADSLTSTSVATTTINKPYPRNSFQRLVATPNLGSRFVGWGGACSVFGSAPVCEGNVSGDGNVWAIFR